MLTITSRDKPIGRAKVSALFFECEPEFEERRRVAKRYGIHEKSIATWRYRHPGCAWSLEQIARQVAYNQNQAKVAERQSGQGKGFGSIAYIDPPSLRDVAVARGVKPDTYRKRLSRGGCRIEATALEYGPHPRSQFRAACRAAGIKPRSVRNWKLRHPGHGLTDEQVIQVVADNKRHGRTCNAVKVSVHMCFGRTG